MSPTENKNTVATYHANSILQHR